MTKNQYLDYLIDYANYPDWITNPTYDEKGRRIMPRMRNVTRRKRFLVAMAAMIYKRQPVTKSGKASYAKTYRLLFAALSVDMQARMTENWIRVRLKRLGLGFSKRHEGETFDYQQEWVVTKLSQSVYKIGNEPSWGEITIISHHHDNGAAWETHNGRCWGCQKEVPANLAAYDKLLKLRKKVS